MKKLLIIILVIITHNGLKAWDGGFCKAYTSSEVALCFSDPGTPYNEGPDISPNAGCQGGQKCVNCDWAVTSWPIGICQNIN